MKAKHYILFIIICTILSSTVLFSANFNNFYLNKNKIYPKLITTFSGQYLSIDELISNILVDFKRIDKYTIANNNSKISFIPSAIFVSFSTNEDNKIIQLYKPIIQLGSKKDEIYIAIEDLPLILKKFNLFSVKELNKDLIIENIVVRTIKPKVIPDKKIISKAIDEVKKNKIIVKDILAPHKTNENTSKKINIAPLDTQKVIPNSYQIPDNLIRRNIKK